MFPKIVMFICCLEEERDSILKDLAVYVSQDCTVYKQDVINICSGK